MHMMIERRAEGDRRIPLRMPVELRPHEFDDSFEADAIDVSRGGLSIRAPYLPEVGSQFLCRFDLLQGEAPISLQGEVVWAHLSGKRSGEFGFRFVDMTDDQAALVAELIAERSALGRAGRPRLSPQGRDGGVMEGASRVSKAAPVEPVRRCEATTGAGSEPEAPIERPADESVPGAHGDWAAAELALDTGGELCGELARCSRSRALFVQTLEVLSVGQGLWLRKPDGEEQRASISDVALRFDGDVPVLAVSVAFDGEEASFSDVEWGGLRTGAPGSDTVPDAEPPPHAIHEGRAMASDGRERTTMSEYARREVEARRPIPAAANLSSRAQPGPGQVQTKPQPHIPQPVPHRDADNPSLTQAPTVRPGTDARVTEDQAGVHQLDWDDAEDAREGDVLFEGDGTRGLASAPSLLSVASGLARWAGRTQAKIASHSQALMSDGDGFVARGREQARILGRTAKALVGPKRRRTTGSPRSRVQGPPPAARSVGRSSRRARSGPPIARVLLVGLVAVGAVALGVYALAPQLGDDPLALHRPVEAAPGGKPAVVPASGSTDATPQVSGAQPLTGTQPDSGAVPRPSSVPASSPYAVNVDEPKPKAPGEAPGAIPPAARGPRFGAADVPRPEAFSLRMSQTVKELRGIPDQGGFTVVIPGSLSLDRAGPIAAKHRAIKRSMILNKGDRSELTIRFESGKRPKYRVEAHGAALRVLIEG